VGFHQAQQQFPSTLQDNYKLKEGLYIRLNPDKTWEEQVTKFEENHLIIRYKENEPTNTDLLNWVKQRDYYSSLVAINKSVDAEKQVHSNNPLALFVKRDVFLGEKPALKYTMAQNVDRYVESTSAERICGNWSKLIPSVKNGGKKSIKKKVDQAADDFPEGLDYFKASDYAEALAYVNTPKRLQLIEGIALWYRNNLAQLTEHIAKQDFKNYVKLFFTIDSTCEQMYRFEYELYTIPKIYNKNDYNQIVHGELVGLPSLDMSMNSEKPFMEHKTMRVEAPDRVSLEQAMLTKDVAEWLGTRPNGGIDRFCYQSGFRPPTVDVQEYSSPEGMFHVYWNNRDKEIHAFENVPFSPALSVNVEWLNILQRKDFDGNLKYYGNLSNVDALQKAISGKFFRGRLSGSFMTNEPDVKKKDFTAIMIALYLQSRQAFYDFLYKGTNVSLRGIFAKVTLRLLEEQLIHVESGGLLSGLADAFNLRLSIEILINEKGGRDMADRIEGTLASLRGKLSGDAIAVCSNDDEFYFMAGQLAYYLLSQSKGDKKSGEMFEPFLRAKNGQHLKKRLEEAYMLYKHAISLGHRKFNHAFSMVMGYVPEQGSEGSSRELLLAGIFAENLLFEKSVKGVE